MSTKDIIISSADELVRTKGYNAFSFKDISANVGIRTASIHYHFPTKTDLGVAVIKDHIHRFDVLKTQLSRKSPLVKLQGFLNMYAQIIAENKVCLVGSLATDLHTVEEPIKKELKKFAQQVLSWVTEIVTEGKQQGVFEFQVLPRTKALLIITNVLAIAQLSRLTSVNDFDIVKAAILKELRPQKP